MYKIGTSLKNWCWPLLWPTKCPADDSLKLWKKKKFHYYLDFLSILAWRVVSEAVVHGSFVQLMDEGLCSCDYEHGHYWCESWTCQNWILGDGWMGPHIISKSILFNWFRVCFAICKPKAFMSTLRQHVNCHFLFFCEGNWIGWA